MQSTEHDRTGNRNHGDWTRAVTNPVPVDRFPAQPTGAGFAGPTGTYPFFVSGGSSANDYNRNRGYEFQDLVTVTLGKTSSKFGGRVRVAELSTQSTVNFNGTYSFANPKNAAAASCLNGTGYPDFSDLPALSNPSSLDCISVHEIPQQHKTPMIDILQSGCGPTSYTLNAGVPISAVIRPMRACSRRMTGASSRTSL